MSAVLLKTGVESALGVLVVPFADTATAVAPTAAAAAAEDNPDKPRLLPLGNSSNAQQGSCSRSLRSLARSLREGTFDMTSPTGGARGPGGGPVPLIRRILLVKEPVKEPAAGGAGMLVLPPLFAAKGEGVWARLLARWEASEVLAVGGVGWISIRQRAPSSVTTPRKLPLPMDLWQERAQGS